MVAPWWWDNSNSKAVIVHFVCMGTDLWWDNDTSKAVIVHSVSTVTHYCHVGDGTSPCLHGYILWWWNDSSKSVTVHVVSMVAPWWWDNNNSKAVIVHFVCMGTDYCDGTTILPRLLLSIRCPHYRHDGDGTSPCLHGYTLWWWDNDSFKAVILHFVFMVTHYDDWTTTVPRLYLFILGAWFYTMLTGQWQFEGCIVHFVCNVTYHDYGATIVPMLQLSSLYTWLHITDTPNNDETKIAPRL